MENNLLYEPMKKCKNCGRSCPHYEPKSEDGCLNREIRELKKIEEKLESIFK